MGSHKAVTRANAHAPGIVADYVDYAEVASPSTPSSGYVRHYAKTDGNLYQKDDVGTETSLAAGGGSHTVYGVTVTRSSTSIAQSGVAITWDAEVRDDGGMWDSTPNPTRITIQSTGWYVANAFIEHASDSDGGRRVYWRKNGASTVGRSSVVSPAAMNDPTVQATAIEYLSATDYLELIVDQNAGNNLSVSGRASCVKIPFS